MRTGTHDDLATALGLAVLNDTGSASSIQLYFIEADDDIDSLMADPIMHKNLLDSGF